MEELLNDLIRFALEKKASDIHFIVNHNELKVQIRTLMGIENVIQDIWSVQLFEYMKFISGFDLMNPFLPQSGQFSVSVNHRIIYCRFSVIVNGSLETGVLRLLNTAPSLSIDDLTSNQRHIAYLKSLIHLRQGLVIAVGPTGSGKTTTLHAILHAISLESGHKVVSLEDPIEIEDDNYLQLQINDQIGFTFEKGIEELLRHDPDVILIGETRNEYAARMMVRCALTGSLAFTTLHAKNAMEAIQRLLNLGLTTFDLKDTLTAVIGQRLYRNTKGERECIYEILTGKDLQYVIANQAYPEGFTTLEKEIAMAIADKRIDDPQAEWDLKSFQK